MASANKTPYLKLNQWLGTDKPTRSDFVLDNSIIDEKVGSHINSSFQHLTSIEKEKLDNPYTVKLIQGTGESIRTVTLDFTPSIALCFIPDTPMCVTENGMSTVNAAFSISDVGGSGGIIIAENAVKLRNETEGNTVFNLNASGTQYILAAFR